MFLLLFTFYGLHAAPNAWWGDGLELATAVWTLGIPHPPGYPLYTLVGWIWTHGLAWLLDPGHALTLFSAFCTALACSLLYPWLRDLSFSFSDSSTVETTTLAPLLIIAFLATSRTTWDHATFAEVYPLAFLLVAASLVFICTPRKKIRPVHGLQLGILMGAVGLHHYSGFAIYPMALLLIGSWVGKASRPIRVTTLAACGFLVMIFGWAWLPWRAAQNPPLNWGDPSSMENFLWMLSGGQFTEFHAGAAPSEFGVGVVRWLHWWGVQWIPVASIAREGTASFIPVVLGGGLSAGAVFGLWNLARRNIVAGYGLLMLLLSTLAFSVLYQIPDIDGYFLVALPAMGAGWAITLKVLSARFERQNTQTRLPWGSLLAILLLLTNVLVLSPTLSKRGDEAPLLYGEHTLAALPENTLILTFGDNDIYALWYQQMVLSRRPDVDIFGSNFLYSGWYAQYWKRRDAPLLEAAVHEGSPARHKARFDAQLIARIIRPALTQNRPVAITHPDPLLIEYFTATPLTLPMLPRDYYTWISESRVLALPYPVVYQLTSLQQRISDFSERQLESEFLSWYQQSRPRPRP